MYTVYVDVPKLWYINGRIFTTLVQCDLEHALLLFY